MAGEIASLFVKLGLDAREFQTGISGAQKSVGGFGVNAQTAFKVIGAGASVGFGLATKGALEAEAAQGKFMAATGKTREEAKKFVSGMDSLAGTAGAVGKSFEEIAATGTMVEQQFGTTGQATTDLTGHILEFSKVTGQDATQAAGALEDALSAFGLDSNDAAGLMDQLVASSQKFGTSAGPDAVSALNDMAPALTAMGMGLDDGVELLNAFEVAGGDAGDAAKGLRTAVAQLKPGENIDTLITKIAAIEDPLLKNQAAVDAFGKKMGPELAKLIKPGMTSLDDFGISAEEAAGSAGKAADDMLTFGDRIKGWADKAMAGARELGQEFGPLATGLASIGSLAAPFTGKLTGLFKGLLSSGPIKAAAAAVGAMTGAAQAAAHELAATGTAAVKSLFTRIAGMAIPLAPAGTTVGTALGGAMAAGMAVGLIGAVAGIATLVGLELQKHQDEMVDFIFGDNAALNGAAKNYAYGISSGLEMGLSQSEAMERARNFVTMTSNIDVDAARARAYELGLLQGDAVGGGAIAGFVRSEVAERMVSMTAPAFARAGEDTGVGFMQAAGKAIIAEQNSLANDGREAMVFAGRAMEQQGLADAAALGAGVPGQIGSAIYDNATKILPGIAEIRRMLKEGLTPEQIAAQAIGEDFIKDVGKGMMSEIPGLKETSQQTAIQAINAIEDAGLEGKKGQKGLKAIGIYYDQLLASGMTAEQARTALLAGGVALAVVDTLDNSKVQTAASTGGANDAKAFISGFSKRMNNAQWDNIINNSMGDYWHGQSPPKKGPLHHIDKWGFNVMSAWIGGGVDAVKSGMGRLAGAVSFSPAMAPAYAGGYSAMPGGGAMIEGGITMIFNGPVYGGREGAREIAKATREVQRQDTRGGLRDVGAHG